MASEKNEYEIKLNKDLFIDPDFKKSKNFATYFPIKFSTINHRLWTQLSSNARSMLLELLSLAYAESSTCITVNADLLQRYRGVTVDMLFSELNDFKYLECPKLNINLNEIKSKSNLNKNTRDKKKGSVEPSENLPDLSANKTKLFIAKYCELFKTKYGTNPIINGKTSGIAKRLSESLSAEKAELFLQAFFALPDALLHKNRHPLNQFELKLNEITVFANTGKFTTQTQAYNQDKKIQAVQTNIAFQTGENF